MSFVVFDGFCGIFDAVELVPGLAESHNMIHKISIFIGFCLTILGLLLGLLFTLFMLFFSRLLFVANLRGL